MKPLSVEMACLLGIQNKIQAVWTESLFSLVFFLLSRSIQTEDMTPDMITRILMSSILIFTKKIK